MSRAALTVEESSAPLANQKKEMGYTIANQKKKPYLLYLVEI